MELVQTRQFKQAVKKLTPKQKQELDTAIKTISRSQALETVKVFKKPRRFFFQRIVFLNFTGIQTHVSFPNSSLGMPIAKLRLVCQGTKQVYLYAHNG